MLTKCFPLVNGFHMMLRTRDFSDGKYMSVISQKSSEEFPELVQSLAANDNPWKNLWDNRLKNLNKICKAKQKMIYVVNLSSRTH